MRHTHYPSEPGRLLPYPPGFRSTCSFCRKPIVFIEGYDFRRDYWRLLPASNRDLM